MMDFGKRSNTDMRRIVRDIAEDGYTIVLEMVASYGMPVGKTTFETVLWTGVFWEIGQTAGPWGLVAFRERKEILSTLCHSARANDAAVRQRLIDMCDPTLEPRPRAKPGTPLYGISKDVWSALSIATAYRIGRANLERGDAPF